MKKIAIPTPCSEDWNRMTPTEKGAFCKKCNLEVIDFTQKTPDEIRETLTLNIGKKTCGHIGKNQLELANSNFYFWENQSPQILRSKFLYACLMVFGMTLFTGCDNLKPEEDVVNGGMEHVEGKMDIIDEDTLSDCNNDTLNDGSYLMPTELKGEMRLE